MAKLIFCIQKRHILFFVLILTVSGICAQQPTVKDAHRTDNTIIQINLNNGQKMFIDFYGENIFRWFYSRESDEMHPPAARPPAQILVDNSRKKMSVPEVNTSGELVTIHTNRIVLSIDKSTLKFSIKDKQSGKTVVESASGIETGTRETTLKLKGHAEEYFFGGGVQNGRFSHKGNVIAIENQNSWTDGGVASPAPFYWSTNGYGVMWHTFKKGKYDFGKEEKGIVRLSHETDYLDVFFMIDSSPELLLSDYYQLTGNPVLMPKFAFYEGHLNAYNRDYWKENENGILFEDGQRYSESQKDNGGVKESLNGEKNNYQFSARAVIDRYAAHDMPLGWILPNDGYGAGYGQTSTLDSNILNLKEFGDYARKKGVEIGLWTQSDLHPKPGISALLQRDIEKEVGVAGVNVLKTDVAWVGPGYSFGLNGIADASAIMKKFGNNARSFIISLDGWAGTQRYAGVWSGDQTGGEWEYIRFHIPTYIGSGLSGMPNISSDMDGIFGGKKSDINIRDFQWKTFSLMQLNMDGWGSNPKYPSALGEPATSINRNYLKLKSELLPYAYSISHEAVTGLPQIRAMFLEEKNSYTLGTATRYQYMFGLSFLIAPIYQNTSADLEGNDIRDGIYLPEGKWIDYYSGDTYTGGKVINNFNTPIWKLPVFVKAGAIIPMVNPNNNVSEIKEDLRIYEVYPFGKSSFMEYDDDGKTRSYEEGESATTLIESEVTGSDAVITVHPASGYFPQMVKEKSTVFKVNVTSAPSKVTLTHNGKKMKLKAAKNLEDFWGRDNVYFYYSAPDLNRFSTSGSDAEGIRIIKNPQLWVKTAKRDITKNLIRLKVENYVFDKDDGLLHKTGDPLPPSQPRVSEAHTGAYSLVPEWGKVNNADYYEIEFNGMLYSTIQNSFLSFEGLVPETDYHFKVRSVNQTGHSAWQSFTARTAKNPLEFAIHGITGSTSVPNQGGQGIDKLFDFDESNLWHTQWSSKAVPFDLTIDLNTITSLDRFEYLPREKGNGVLQQGTVYHSLDKNNWKEVGEFDWKYDGDTKVFDFQGNPQVRYLKISVTKGVGDFGSGREMYVFKVPGAESILPGDINHDGKVDQNDLTSYLNYTGLRRGDGDFEGYISRGDLNGNGVIDAYDISNTAIKLNGGLRGWINDRVEGNIEISADKSSFRKNDLIQITVKGTGLKDVNALSFALPYDEELYEYVRMDVSVTGNMENMTNNRLHSDGERVLYPTLVNIGQQPVLNGNIDLFTITLKAKKNGKYNLKAEKGILVDRNLNSVDF